MKLIRNYLIEDVISKENLKINVRYQTIRTKHSIEREKRDGYAIPQNEIISLVRLGMQKITVDMILNKINLNEKLLIQDLRNNLNIVGVVENKGSNELDFVIITVMRKKGFKAKSNTHVVTI